MSQHPKKRRHNPDWDFKIKDSPLALFVRPRLERMQVSLPAFGKAVGMSKALVYMVLSNGRSLAEHHHERWLEFLGISKTDPAHAEFVAAAHKQSILRERKKGIAATLKWLEADRDRWKARALTAEAEVQRLRGP